MTDWEPYHRLESPTQTPKHAAEQALRGEIWGQEAKWSSIPSVKAWRGILPDGTRGVEFTTQVAPHSDTHPSLMRWLEGDPGVVVLANGYVSIPVSVTRNTQV